MRFPHDDIIYMLIGISLVGICGVLFIIFRKSPTAVTDPPKYKLIGLSGKIGVGKDTVANWICEAYPDYKVVPFASAVKKVVSIMTGTSYESQFTREGKTYVPPGYEHSVSKYHQIVGQFGRDYIHKDIWINTALRHPAKYKIIPDVRYPNEADAIKAAGGIVIRISGNRTTPDDGRDLNHISETAMDNYYFEHMIFNHGTLADFQKRVFWTL